MKSSQPKGGHTLKKGMRAVKKALKSMRLGSLRKLLKIVKV
jgi:hypothetical protein